MKRSLLVPLIALVVHPIVALAQVSKDTARIAPVVVTATRSPLAEGRAPASVSVITGEKLRREGITTVLDALRRVPGLAVVQTGSYGGVTSLFIRGGESKYAKVLIDGVPVNDAGGAFDFSALSTDNLERIEIVRGPASVLYGSDAMAGVVQLFTRAGTGRPRAEVSGRGGGYAKQGRLRDRHGRFDSTQVVRSPESRIPLIRTRRQAVERKILVQKWLVACNNDPDSAFDRVRNDRHPISSHRIGKVNNTDRGK